jgi:hypothetical protein
MAWRFGDKTVLFKKSRSGGDLYLSIPLPQLRQVADEMDVYCTYGRMLGAPIFPGTASPRPKKPSLPVPLKYEPVPGRD